MIRQVGSISVITGIAQMVLRPLSDLAFVSSSDLAWFALYLSVAFTFSSTIIVLRLLQEKEQEETLVGRIAIGFLLIQDVAAMLIFISFGFGINRLVATDPVTLLVKLCAVMAAVHSWSLGYTQPELILAKQRVAVFIFIVLFHCAASFELMGFSRELAPCLLGAFHFAILP